jgi:hypothetical protein
MFASSDWIAAAVPRDLAVVRDANTTDERIPMMAITTKSSMRVKPLEEFFMINLTNSLF